MIWIKSLATRGTSIQDVVVLAAKTCAVAYNVMICAINLHVKLGCHLKEQGKPQHLHREAEIRSATNALLLVRRRSYERSIIADGLCRIPYGLITALSACSFAALGLSKEFCTFTSSGG